MLASKVACPSCHSGLKADKPLPAGMKVKCPKCGTHFKVPGGNGAADHLHTTNGNGAPATAVPLSAIQPPHMLPPAGPPLTAAVVAGGNSLPPISASASQAPAKAPNKALIGALAVGGFVVFLGLGAVVLCVCLALSGNQPTATDSEEPPAATAAATPATVKPRPRPLIVLSPEQQQKVDTATQRGVAYLKKIQMPDGSWAGIGHAGPDPVGYTSLASLALIECNVPKDDSSIQKAAAFVRNACPKLTGTYTISLAILFLHHLADPADEGLIRELALRLANGQTPSGGWSYTCRILSKGEQEDLSNILDTLSKRAPEAALQASNAVPASFRQLAVLQKGPERPNDFYRGGGDNSNTQFALLALLAARRHGVNLDPSLALIAKRFRASQNPDGSWNYAGRHNAAAWPTMTCAGLLGVAVDYAVAKDIRKVQRPEQDPAVQKALEHVSKHIGEPIRNPKAPLPMMRMYYLWCVERVGVLYRLRDIKGKQWYEWGMENLVQNQHDDGSWPCADNRGWALANTCFALLFLQRVDLAEDLTDKIRELAEMPVWRDDSADGARPSS